MKSISFWAHNHKAAARISIILIYFLLNAVGLFMGDILFSMNILLSPLYYVFAILIGIFGLIIYPSKKIKSTHKNFYFQQKTADIILLISTFIFIIYTGNIIYNPGYKAVENTWASNAVRLNSNTSSPGTNQRVIVSKKEGHKKLRNIIREFRKRYKESTKGQKTLYIIISAIVAAGLILGVSVLSCNIGCSGSVALAYIVLFLGLGGIIFGLVKIIQRINRGGPKIKP